MFVYRGPLHTRLLSFCHDIVLKYERILVIDKDSKSKDVHEHCPKLRELLYLHSFHGVRETYPFEEFDS
jgi:hypothetical protein